MFFLQFCNHPAPNLPAGQLVNVTLRRYVDMLEFGLVSCPTIVPDLDRLRDHFLDAYEQLKRASSARTS